MRKFLNSCKRAALCIFSLACLLAGVSRVHADELRRVEMQANNAAARMARHWTDVLLDKVRHEYGTELWASQKVMAYDFFYAYAHSLSARNFRDPDESWTDVIWMRTDALNGDGARSGVTTLFQWIGRLSGFPSTVHFAPQATAVNSRADYDRLIGELRHLAPLSALIVLDDVTGNQDLLTQLAVELRSLNASTTFLIVDRHNLATRLGPAARGLISVLDERNSAPTCKKALLRDVTLRKSS